MKYSFVIAALLGLASAKHAHQRHSHSLRQFACPHHEPLCEEAQAQRQQIYTNAQKSSHEMPACPAIEPLCEKSSNSKQQIYTNA